MNHKPEIISFRQLGSSSKGYISVANFDQDLPFTVRRAFWTYETPQKYARGNHAHYKTNLVLIAVSGQIEVTLRSSDGEILVHHLNSPEKGLFIPPNYWRSMKYSENAVQLVLASTKYDESDYIRSLKKFDEHWSP